LELEPSIRTGNGRPQWLDPGLSLMLTSAEFGSSLERVRICKAKISRNGFKNSFRSWLNGKAAPNQAVAPDPRERRFAPPLGRVNGDVRFHKCALLGSSRRKTSLQSVAR